MTNTSYIHLIEKDLLDMAADPSDFVLGEIRSGIEAVTSALTDGKALRVVIEVADSVDEIEED